jgi:N-acetylglucosaminyl-diphospho-decaprenol L-rhamnosyltransferase
MRSSGRTGRSVVVERAGPGVTPWLSVVIVNWNARDHLLRCLSSLEQNPPDCAWEAIVVDNGSSDGSVDAVSAVAPWARVVANRSNRGLPAANNQGFLAAQGELLLVSNPDVVYLDQSITRLCHAMDRHVRAAIIVPQLVQREGQRQTSAGSLPTLREAVTGSMTHRAPITATSGFWWHRWAHDEERRIGHGAEACYLVRRAAVIDVGPQDERFPLDWEGIDWSARMADAGWEVWFVPAAVIEHAGGASVKQAPYRWIVSSHRGMYRYFRRRQPAAMIPVSAGVIGARAGVKLGAEAFGRRLYDRAHTRARIDDEHRSVEIDGPR